MTTDRMWENLDLDPNHFIDLERIFGKLCNFEKKVSKRQQKHAKLLSMKRVYTMVNVLKFRY